MKAIPGALAAALAFAAALGAQEPASDDETFGGGVIVDVEEQQKDRSKVLLESQGVEIGGTFRFKADSSWTYDGAEGPFGASLVGDPLEIDLGAKLFLDARPSEDLRVFGKLNLSSPFDNKGGTRAFDDVFHVTELFSDFHLGDAVFFRAGKQTIHWGVGYFFSPADLLNVTEIDPEDPAAELEGPVALKVQAPVGPHNLYLYTVLQNAAAVDEVAVAPKLELVAGRAELGLGGYYRRGDAPAAMATLTGGSGDWKLFAEGVLSYGSNRRFVVEDPAVPAGVRVEAYDDGLYPSATAGLRYVLDDELDRFDTTVVAQYMFNGEGYSDPDLLAARYTAVQALLASGGLSPSDLRYTGRHYAAASVTWSQMFASDFSLSALWLANLSDGSGMVAPSLRFAASDELDLALKVSVMYGGIGSEYSRSGDAMTISLSANLGGGNF